MAELIISAQEAMRSLNVAELQKEFVGYMPRIRDRAEYVFRNFRGRSIGIAGLDFEDLVNRVLVIAWEEFVKSSARGCVFVGCITKHACQQVAEEAHKAIEEQFRYQQFQRDSSSQESHLDEQISNERVRQYKKAHAGLNGTKHAKCRNANTRERSQRRPRNAEEKPSNATWRDILTTDSELAPAEYVQASEDFELYLSRLRPSDRIAARSLAAGNSPGWVAEQLGIKYSTFQIIVMRRLRRIWNTQQ